MKISWCLYKINIVKKTLIYSGKALKITNNFYDSVTYNNVFEIKIYYIELQVRSFTNSIDDDSSVFYENYSKRKEIV